MQRSPPADRHGAPDKESLRRPWVIHADASTVTTESKVMNLSEVKGAAERNVATPTPLTFEDGLLTRRIHFRSAGVLSPELGVGLMCERVERRRSGKSSPWRWRRRERKSRALRGFCSSGGGI